MLSVVVLEVRFFASLVERAGRASESVDVGQAGLPDVQALWGWLVRHHPALGEVDFRPLAACDRVYAGWDQPLDGVREVAFLPPFSGG